MIFSSAYTNLDAYAGLLIIDLLENRIPSAIYDYNKFQNLLMYQHTYLNHINLDYMHIHGATAYWINHQNDAVNLILDKIQPDNAPHQLNESEQLQFLNHFMNGLPRP